MVLVMNCFPGCGLRNSGSSSLDKHSTPPGPQKGCAPPHLDPHLGPDLPKATYSPAQNWLCARKCVYTHLLTHSQSYAEKHPQTPTFTGKDARSSIVGKHQSRNTRPTRPLKQPHQTKTHSSHARPRLDGTRFHQIKPIRARSKPSQQPRYTKPLVLAHFVSSLRFDSWSFRNTADTCVSTVLTER